MQVTLAGDRCPIEVLTQGPLRSSKHQECQAQKGEDTPGRQWEEQGSEGHSPENMMKDMGEQSHFYRLPEILPQELPAPWGRGLPFRPAA